ncbi:unnamed protein product [Caretta caretta]
MIVTEMQNLPKGKPFYIFKTSQEKLRPRCREAHRSGKAWLAEDQSQCKRIKIWLEEALLHRSRVTL